MGVAEIVRGPQPTLQYDVACQGVPVSLVTPHSQFVQNNPDGSLSPTPCLFMNTHQVIIYVDILILDLSIKYLLGLFNFNLKV